MNVDAPETVEVAGRVADRKEENCDRLGLWGPQAHAQNFAWPESLHSRSLQHSTNATKCHPLLPTAAHRCENFSSLGGARAHIQASCAIGRAAMKEGRVSWAERQMVLDVGQTRFARSQRQLIHGRRGCKNDYGGWE